jgi:hypothetical protein
MVRHSPPTQSSPALHTFPHAPQLFGSTPVLTHAVPHVVQPLPPDELLLDELDGLVHLPSAVQVWP